MKTVYCMIAPNGSGKTEIIKRLIQDHQWNTVQIYRREIWDVISPVWIKGRPRTPDDRAIVVGKYGSLVIGGGDLMGRKPFFKAMEAAANWRGANKIIVEALKISAPHFYRELEKFCKRHGFNLHATLIKADPVTCYTRQVKRGAPKATYPVETVFMRCTRSRYLYEIIPKEQKSLIENMGDPQVAADKYMKILFPGGTK